MIRDAAAEYGLREPEFIEMDDTFRINLYRNTSGANGANIDANDANIDANNHMAGLRSGIHVPGLLFKGRRSNYLL